MSGDVFGNGVLLSRHIRLVAAFNHLHIFIDPNPDSARSYRERARLFRNSRSSWADYNAKLISPGGGVFPRSAKSIAVTKQVQARLGIEKGNVTPDQLVSLLLSNPVDLIWNGGIGTYVKASSENHAEVGDKAHDAARVNGSELRCKVIGEGGGQSWPDPGSTSGVWLAGRRLIGRLYRQLGGRGLFRSRSEHKDLAERTSVEESINRAASEFPAAIHD
jgi:glutamate dehydrogenase